MALVERSMKRPVTVTMITVAALLFGAVSLSRLPLNLLPDITYPSLTIQTEYADAAPAEIEKLITEPLEEAVSVVPGLKLLRSVSRPGVSEITLEFAWKTNMDFAALDVREKIDLVNLPGDADKPVLLRYDPSLDPILRVGLSGDKDLVTLRYLGERVLKKDLESLEGVASVRIRGGLEEEIHVAVDEKKLAALGIPIRTVSDFLMNQNLNAAGGRLRDRDAEFLVRTTNEFENMDDIRQTVLFEEANRRVKLEDVASISRGYKEREVVSRVRGKDAVELAIYKEGNANTVQVARAVKARIEWLNKGFEDDVRADVLFDQSTFIEKSIQEVRSNAIVGGLLAVFVLFLFLKDRRSTAVISLVIPISILTTFFAMQQFGVSLNIMSFGGLALGVGMLVDNAIVVLEAINRHRTGGKSVWDATLDGASEVSRAVTASTLTTVAVFLPIIFVEGIAGQIFRDQALTVTASLVVSLIAALTLIPVLASVGSRARGPLHIDAGDGDTPESGDGATGPKTPAKPKRRLPGFVRVIAKPFQLLFAGIRFLLVWLGRFLAVLLPGTIFRILAIVFKILGRALDVVIRPVQAVFDRAWGFVARAYPSILESALTRPGRTLTLTLIVAALAIATVPRLGVELVPPFTQGEFAFDLELPPGTPLQKTADRVHELEKGLANDSEIGIYFTSVGESPDLGSARNQRRENIGQINIAV
ncbi:MAG: efflux RND transporter permease subunit, partial [Gemmatimonadetes bacterium]|nr:efflux RND transporter permease subunit [Gemmatimonadota bacterium]